MSINQTDIATITALVGRFENGNEPYLGATGDFDGQGISCGVLQWNIGQGSLQPMILKAGRDTVQQFMPNYGDAMWKACTSPIPQGLTIVRSWQVDKKLSAGPRNELRSLMGSPALRTLQDEAITKVAQKADNLAVAWANAHGAEQRTKQELAFFFDLVTQNGGSKELAYADVTSFRQAVGDTKADDLVCDWLLGTKSQMWGHKDAHRNAELWRNTGSVAQLDLLIFAYLRSQKSFPKARADVLNRKGTIAMLRGYVHTTLYDLSGIF